MVLLISNLEVFIFTVILHINLTSLKDELLERKAEGKIKNLEEPPSLRIREGKVKKQNNEGE